MLVASLLLWKAAVVPRAPLFLILYFPVGLKYAVSGFVSLWNPGFDKDLYLLTSDWEDIQTFEKALPLIGKYWYSIASNSIISESIKKYPSKLNIDWYLT